MSPPCQAGYEGGPGSNAGRRLLGGAAVGFYQLFARSRDKAFSFMWAGAFASYGRRSVIQLPVRLRGVARIAVGNEVFIGSGSWLNVEGEADGDVALSIGSGTSMVGGSVISAARPVRIGRRVLMARNVYISDHMHAFEDLSKAVLEQGIARTAPVEIGDGAWLGQNVVVGPGVRVGRGAVVGANSVVLADVADYTVVAGAPARLIRRLDTDAETSQ
jgi:acetyltransferase-like isoleucine patch superfamily enzyme